VGWLRHARTPKGTRTTKGKQTGRLPGLKIPMTGGRRGREMENQKETFGGVAIERGYRQKRKETAGEGVLTCIVQGRGSSTCCTPLPFIARVQVRVGRRGKDRPLTRGSRRRVTRGHTTRNGSPSSCARCKGDGESKVLALIGYAVE